MSQAGERRSARIESLRALAALLVVACHTYAFTNGFELDTYGERAILGLGLVGVNVFFALTGYLLFLPFARRDYAGGRGLDLRGYALNRALRILPLYYAVLVVVLVVNGAALGTAVRFLTFTQNFREELVAKAVNGPMWSLVVELHFYVLLPALAWALARLARGSARRAALWLLALGAASAGLSELRLQPADVWTYSFPAKFQYFVPGMLLALARARSEVARPRWLEHPLLRADLCLAASVAIWAVVFADSGYRLLPLSALACLLTVAAGTLAARGRADRVLDARWPAAVGVASYSLYLWHVPVLGWLPLPAGGGAGAWAAFSAYAVPVCLAVAFASYRLVEAPPLRLRRPWFAGSTAPGRAWWPAWPARAAGLGPAVGLLGLALAVRVAVLAATWRPQLGADGSDYDRLARSLAAGDGFGSTVLAAGGGPTAFRPPGYPLFLAGVYNATGGSANAARALQVLLGVAAVALLGWIAYRLWGRRVALLAMGVAAVYPPLALISESLLSESVFIPLALAALAAAVEYRHRGGGTGLVALAGVAAGLATLIRPVGAALALAVAVLLWTGRPRRSARALAAPAAVLALSVALVVPWTVRNLVVTGHLTPVATLDAFNLAGTYNDFAAGDRSPYTAGFHIPSLLPQYAAAFRDPSLDEAGLAAHLRREAVGYIREHPGYVVEVMAWNTARLVHLTGPRLVRAGYLEDWGYGWAWADLAFAAWIALALLALAGALTRAARRAPPALWLTPLLLWAATVPVIGDSRFRTPLEPFAILLAALALDALGRRGRGGLSRPAWRARGRR